MTMIAARKQKLFLFLLFLFVYGFYVSVNNNFTNYEVTDFYDENPKFRNWLDTELLEKDKSRVGLGEHGADVTLTDESEIALNAKLYAETGFAVVVSDKVSVNRSLPIVVHADCNKIEYYANLPKVSVIIIFHNEVKSVLLRTVHSVINRTPSELLLEVILVNDFSSNPELYKPLQDYIANNFFDKVSIKNLKKRSGLIVTRMEGARIAKGEVLVFFDSHVEVHFNWLPPLLQPIVENRRIATLPIIDYFNPETFGYYDGQENFQGSRGVVDWYLDFHELPKLPRDIENDLNPFPNPIMLGCAFAIDRKFFLEELKGYDEGLQIWNGENYELSFKLWMCADGLFTVPCSRVAHSFRNINPSRNRSEDYVARNFKRIAEVWLDEFKNLPMLLEPKRYANVDSGDLSLQKEIRKELNCKSFKWFLTEVAPDMINYYPPLIDPPKFASGAIQSIANSQLCIENVHEKLEVAECSNNLQEPGANQKFVYSFFKDIRQIYDRHELCMDAYKISLENCNHLPFGNQFWIYNKNTKRILYAASDEIKCLTLELSNKTLTLTSCNNDRTQMWNFAFVNETAYESFNDIFGYASILS